MLFRQLPALICCKKGAEIGRNIAIFCPKSSITCAFSAIFAPFKIKPAHRKVQITFETHFSMYKRTTKSADKTLSALSNVSTAAICITEQIRETSPCPGPSINGRKSYDLDWPQATERPLGHPTLPGHSKIHEKSSDLDGREGS